MTTLGQSNPADEARDSVLRSGSVSSRNDLFGVIYCDPPWRMETGNQPRYANENHYPTMSTKEICALELPAAKNCVLFMWATVAHLDKAFVVLNAWRFKYKSCATWDKMRTGTGWWFLGQHELLLVATRGKMSPPIPELRISSVIRLPRGEHSSKPDWVRDKIKLWFPQERKLEMFARPWTKFWPKHDGWETWGNELPNDVAITPNDDLSRTR
jgi:N6-adenosine-specific RNA methylase IME4